METKSGRSLGYRNKSVYEQTRESLRERGHHILDIFRDTSSMSSTRYDIFHLNGATVTVKGYHVTAPGGPSYEFFSFEVVADSQKKERQILSDLEREVEILEKKVA